MRRKLPQRVCLRLGLTGLLCFGAVALTTPILIPTAHASGDAYYAGKTIRIVVAFTPGGAFDVTTRFFARHLPKYIPGSPSILVQNMPGAGGRLATNYMFNVAKPDGLTIGNIHPQVIHAQVAKEAGVEFDLLRFEWIAGIPFGGYVLAIRSDLPYKRPEQLRDLAKPLHVAGNERTSTSHLYVRILQEFGGLQLNPVTGYVGSGPQMAAVARGEADARAASANDFLPHIKEGTVRPIIRARFASDPPLLRDVTVDRKIVRPEGHGLLDAILAPLAVGRAYVAPPGTPPSVTNILRRSFSEAMQDPALQQALLKGFMITDPKDFVEGDEAKRILSGVVALPGSVWEELMRLQR